MQKKWSPSDLEAIEARLAVREEAKASQDRILNAVFWFGLISGILGGVLKSMPVFSPIVLIAALVWVAAVVVYTAGKAFPHFFSRDLDVGWHLNPWREAISYLVAEGREWKGIILFFAYPIGRIVGVALMLTLG